MSVHLESRGGNCCAPIVAFREKEFVCSLRERSKSTLISGETNYIHLGEGVQILRYAISFYK
jgi:hypothetical protein